MDLTAILTLATIVLPLAGAALVVPASALGRTARDLVALVATGATLLASVSLVLSLNGVYPATIGVNVLLGEATLVVDAAGHLFAVLVAFVWFCCTLASLDYLARDEKASRYQAVSLVVLSAMMGVGFAGDLVMLFLFFEVAGVTSYLLVVHKGTSRAQAAAGKYLAMTLASGFALLAGILIVFQMGSDGTLVPIGYEGAEAVRWLAASLLVVGFGIKAGMVPVHVWLPDAHPVAPSPASALLSGVIIKTGAFGIFRTLYVLYGPAEGGWFAGGAGSGQQVGWALLAIGIASMLAGVFMALGQHDIKRMLAYSSVSQIGFVLAGIGAAVYLADGAYAAYGLAGGLYHIVNHALYKVVLFLGAGAVLLRAGTVDMRELGGLRASMPATFVLMLVAAAGIVGLPPLNGFASKSLIHHAVEAAEPVRLIGGVGPLEIGFVLAGGGTFAVVARLLWRTFGGETRTGPGRGTIAEAPVRMLLSMAAPGVAMLVLGLAPLVLVRQTLIPVAAAYGLDTGVLVEYRQFTAEHFGYAALTIVVGVALLAFDAKTGMLSRPGLSWLSFDRWYRHAASGTLRGAQAAAERYESLLLTISGAIRRARTSLLLAQRRSSRTRRRFVSRIVEGTPAERYRAAADQVIARLEAERDSTVERAVEGAFERQGEAPACPGRGCDEYVDAVRDIAGYLAQRLYTEHVAVATDATRHDPERGVEAVKIALREVGEGTADTIVSWSLELALERMEGRNVIPDMSALVVRILRAEEFPRRLSQSMRTFWQRPVTGDRSLRPAGGPARVVWNVTGRLAAPLVDFARIVVGAFTRERTDWGEDPPEQQRVVEVRLFVQRASRDLRVAAVVMVAGLLVFFAALS